MEDISEDGKRRVAMGGLFQRKLELKEQRDKLDLEIEIIDIALKAMSEVVKDPFEETEGGADAQVPPTSAEAEEEPGR